MFSLDLESPQADRDLLIAELFDSGCSGLNELSDTNVRAFFDDEESAAASAKRFGESATGGRPRSGDGSATESSAANSRRTVLSCARMAQ